MVVRFTPAEGRGGAVLGMAPSDCPGGFYSPVSAVNVTNIDPNRDYSKVNMEEKCMTVPLQLHQLIPQNYLCLQCHFSLPFLPPPYADSHHNKMTWVNFILILAFYCLGHFTYVGYIPCFYLFLFCLFSF